MTRRGDDWQRPRRVARWLALAGALVGSAAAVAAFAPASWLASALASATDQRFLLGDARGSVWSGSAQAVLTGGPGSRDAAVLPGRLSWTLGFDGLALAVTARQACCINGALKLRIEPGLGRLRVTLPASQGALGQWPAGWLAGLGTPFNAMRLGGWLSLSSTGLVVESAEGRVALQGGATLSANALSSGMTTLEALGSYRLALTGGPVSSIVLSTLEGPLRLSGSGQWSASGLRFRGQASADAGAETALNNLLNIIGRRQGAVAILSIG